MIDKWESFFFFGRFLIQRHPDELIVFLVVQELVVTVLSVTLSLVSLLPPGFAGPKLCILEAAANEENGTQYDQQLEIV